MIYLSILEGRLLLYKPVKSKMETLSGKAPSIIFRNFTFKTLYEHTSRSCVGKRTSLQPEFQVPHLLCVPLPISHHHISCYGKLWEDVSSQIAGELELFAKPLCKKREPGFLRRFALHKQQIRGQEKISEGSNVQPDMWGKHCCELPTPHATAGIRLIRFRWLRTC